MLETADKAGEPNPSEKAAIPAKSRPPKKLYLPEALRGLAAFYVFIGHLFRQTLPNPSAAVKFCLGFGQEMVMLFFVLSGFVIYYSCHERIGMTFREYFARRFARIYPIFVFGLALAYLAACLQAGKLIDLDLRNLFGNLAMLQDNAATNRPNTWFAPYMGNSALWSLSYEWWYYMLFFPLYFAVSQKWRLPIVGLISVAATVSMLFYPNTGSQILSYFILWWAGAELARAYLEKGWPTVKELWPAIVLLVLCVAIRTPHGALSSFFRGEHGFHPYVEFWNLTAGTAIVILAVIIGRKGSRLLQKTLTPFSLIAPVSYGLYVVHGPMVFYGDWLAPLHYTAVKAVAYIAIALCGAYIAERVYQPRMSRLILGALLKKYSRPGVHA